MKQLTVFLLAMLMIATPMSVLSGSAISSEPAMPVPMGGGTFGGGNGTVWAPYNITDIFDLQAMQNDTSAHYQLVNDIDASDTVNWNGIQGFVPVGNSTAPFTGLFNGQGHTISGLVLNRPENYQALFGYTSSTSLIENVHISNVSVNCWQWRGAIIGLNAGGTIRNCSSSGTIGYASSNAGGLVGRSVGGIIDNCSSSCSISSTNGNNIGGLVGQANGGTIITNSHSTGNVQGVTNVGGFIGYHTGDDSTVDGCTASGIVNGSGVCIGGFVGQNMNGADVYNSSASGNVYCTGPNLGVIGTGGFVGANYWNLNGPTTIQFCFASGNVNGTSSVGGFAGSNGDQILARIFDCYSLGNAYASVSTVGGFMGSGSEGPLMRCYSTGAPSSPGGGVGGFAGYVGFASASNFQNNRWDISTSAMGAPISVGNSSQIFGNTTAELLMQSTYNGSDFTNDWWMIDGQTRPFLRMEWNQNITNSHQLQLMQMDLAADYTLANDIDLSDITEASQMWGTSLTTGGGFVSIAYDTDSDTAYNGTPFSGSLSGNNFTISNLFINRSTDYYIGLFGYAALGTKFKDLEIEGSYVSGKGDVGLLVGCNNAGSIDNCHSTGTAKGTEGDIGGLIGWNLGGTVTNCTSHTNIPLAKRWAGGLIGYSNGLVNNCTAYGDTVGTGDWIGGLIGQMWAGTVSNCSAYGDATGINNVGGLLGENGADVENSDAHGAADGTAYVGGFAGYNSGGIRDSSSSSEVNGSNSIGGLVGWNLPGSSIHNSSSIGNVSGTLYIGGLVGRNDGSIDFGHSQSTIPSFTGSVCGGLVGRNTGSVNNSYATSAINGITNIGGLVGWNDYGTLNNSYATGEVVGTSDYVGGLVGYNEGPVTNSHAEGDVEGSDYVGGLSGYNTADVTDSTAYGNVTGLGTDEVGGLIGYNDAATIDGCRAFGNVSGSANNMGGLIGENSGTVINSDSYGYVNNTGADNTGGLIGYNQPGGSATNCSAYGDASGSNDWIGGLIGTNDGAVENCNAFGNTTGYGADSDYVGGLIGTNTGQLTNCTSFGDVLNGHMFIGGLVGQNNGGTIFKCSAYGTIHATSSVSGGLVGENGGKIENSSAYATLYGMSWTGGLAGTNLPGAVIRNCTANGYTSGSQKVGGLVGGNNGEISTSYSMGTVHAISTLSHVGGLVGSNFDATATITNCYSQADVSGDKSVGGLVGNITNGATITNCYSAGLVAGNVSVGGLIGTAYLSTVNDCFWDLNTTGRAASAGGIGKITTDMMQQATFDLPWDFATIWGIHEANTYPFLRAFGVPSEPQADLEVTLDDNADPVMFGDVLTYHATLTNHGPGNAIDVKVNVTLPIEVTLIDTSPGMVVSGGRWITGNPGTVANGTVQHLFINVTVNPIGGAQTLLQLSCAAFATSSTIDPGVFTNSTTELTTINRVPVPENKSYQTTEDYVQSFPAPGILGGAYDPDLDVFTVIANEPSDYGATVTILANGNFTYDPTVSAALQALHGGVTVYDTFNYTISDGRGGFASALITMQVDGQEGRPTAVNDTFTVVEDSGPNVLTGILSNDIIDEEGDAITISSVSVPWQGTATVTGGGTTITFEPRENFFGSFTFTYWISDGHTGTSTGSINMTVTGVNDAPFITNVDISSISAQENASYSYVFEGVDYDNDTLTWSVNTNTTWLTMNPTTGNLSGTPPLGSAGGHSVNLTLSDGHGGLHWHQFTLTVSPDPNSTYDPADLDGDGVPNDQDAFPLDADETTDTDDDGVGDNADAFPTDPAASVDADDDGYPDAWNPGYTADDSTTGLVLDPDPTTPETLGPDDQRYDYTWMIILLIIIIVAVAAAVLFLKSKGSKPMSAAEEPAPPEETPIDAPPEEAQPEQEPSAENPEQ
ncbi:MAG: GLUG motif-containing protein [Thermoplasmata archaeon]